MKRLIMLVVAMAIMFSLAVPAFAITPKLKVPTIKIPTIKPTIKVELSEDFWENYFAKNPLNIDFSSVGGK